MDVLVAEDDPVNRRLLQSLLKEDYAVTEVDNGTAALEHLRSTTQPVVALIDWEMPGLEGTEVCRRARERADGVPLHLILVTARGSKADIVEGLRTGANDYITKPFDRTELLARVKIGVQMVELQQALTLRISELKDALARVKQLSGLLPICSYCKKVRDDSNYWTQVESYVMDHTDAQFSHSICPACYEDVVKPEMVKMGIKVD